MNHLILAAWSLAAFAAGALHTTSTSAGDPADLGPAIEAALPRLDAIAENLIATGAIPGLSIAIVHGDEVVYLKGFGVREVGRHRPGQRRHRLPARLGLEVDLVDRGRGAGRRWRRELGYAHCDARSVVPSLRSLRHG